MNTVMEGKDEFRTHAALQAMRARGDDGAADAADQIRRHRASLTDLPDGMKLATNTASCATWPPPGAACITSPTGPKAAKPTSPTWSCSATATTSWSTKAAPPSPANPTAPTNSNPAAEPDHDNRPRRRSE